MRLWAGFSRYGWLAAIAIAYLYVVPYFPRIHSANELPRAYLVEAIAIDHSFQIDRQVARWGATADVSPSGGHQYSNKAPGSSMLAAPFYLALAAIAGPPSLAVTVWLCRVVSGIAPMLAFLALLWRFLARFAPDPTVRRLVLTAYALGSLAMTYSMLFYSHQLGAICIASAWILALGVADGERGPRAMLVAGALAGAAPLVDYQAVFAALPIAAHVLVRLARGPARPRLARLVALAAVGAAPPIALLLGYHAVCFGSPWRTGYDASTTFAFFHQHGFLGITALRAEAFFGSTLRPDNGLLTLSPWWLLAVPGSVALWRSGERAVMAVGLAAAAIYLLFISSINFWRGGWQVGPRYIAAMLPFLLPAVAAQLQAWSARRAVLAIACAAIAVAIVIYVGSAATFPYWPDSVRHPIFDVTFRLLADHAVAPNLGRVLGLGGLLGVVPYAGIVFAAWAWPVARLIGARGLAVSVLLAAAWLAAYAAWPHGGPGADKAYRSVHAAVLDL